MSAALKTIALVVGILGGLIGAWYGIKFFLPSASVTFPTCSPALLGVQITNNGGSTAAVGEMKFQLTIDGVTTTRDVEEVIYVDEGNNRSAPTDPKETSSLAANKLRDYHFPTDGVYFRPGYRSCEMSVNVPIRWGKRPKLYPATCECQP